MAARQWTDEQRKAQAERIKLINRGYNQQGNPVRRVKESLTKCAKDWRVHSRKSRANARQSKKKVVAGVFYSDKRFKMESFYKLLGIYENH